MSKEQSYGVQQVNGPVQGGPLCLLRPGQVSVLALVPSMGEMSAVIGLMLGGEVGHLRRQLRRMQ